MMKISPQAKNTIFQISALLILLAAILYSFSVGVAKYAMIAGVVGFVAVSLTSRYQGKSLRGKRLFNMQIFASLFFAVTAYLMFVDMHEWVITLLIAAVLTLYSTIALSQVYKKEKEEENQ